jgi:uncharacterized protein involved in exopolysaccharide biosynthesis
LVDLAAMLWRERMIVLAVGIALGLAGLALALMQPRYYTARAEVLVRLGQEYVFQPQVGGAGAGAAPKLSEVINSEVQLAGSQEVARRTVEALGPTAIYPELAQGGDEDPALLQRLAVEALQKDFALIIAPETPTIAMTYRSKDRTMAARVLELQLDGYLAFRREVLVGAESGAFDNQRDEFEARLAAVSVELASFLATNRIGDFERELESLGELVTATETEVFATRARLQETQARARSVRTAVEAMPPIIELQSETTAAGQLTALQLEREQLLARYNENAAPIAEIDRRIAQVRAFLDNAEVNGVSRTGPNPVRQQAEGELITLEAEVRAQQDRVAALQAQAAQAADRLRRLQAIEPQFSDLVRERAVLEENARTFAARAEEARAFRQIAGQNTDNISVVERPAPPRRGSSIRMPVALAAFCLAGLLALAAGLARGYLRNRFPTATSAARTLNLPLLGVIEDNAAPRSAA